MTTLTEAQAERWSSLATNGHWRIVMDDGSEIRWQVSGWAPEDYGDGLFGEMVGEGLSPRMWRRSHMVRLALKTARRRNAPTVRIGRPLIGGCCDLAKSIMCVCERAWSCPEHGERHVGTHD